MSGVVHIGDWLRAINNNVFLRVIRIADGFIDYDGHIEADVYAWSVSHQSHIREAVLAFDPSHVATAYHRWAEELSEWVPITAFQSETGTSQFVQPQQQGPPLPIGEINNPSRTQPFDPVVGTKLRFIQGEGLNVFLGRIYTVVDASSRTTLVVVHVPSDVRRFLPRQVVDNYRISVKNPQSTTWDTIEPLAVNVAVEEIQETPGVDVFEINVSAVTTRRLPSGSTTATGLTIRSAVETSPQPEVEDGSVANKTPLGHPVSSYDLRVGDQLTFDSAIRSTIIHSGSSWLVDKLYYRQVRLELSSVDIDFWDDWDDQPGAVRMQTVDIDDILHKCKVVRVESASGSGYSGQIKLLLQTPVATDVTANDPPVIIPPRVRRRIG